MENSPCFCCEMAKYQTHKLLDQQFVMERKNEFYPDEEFGEFVSVCEDCHVKLLKYCLNE
jgi:hypothetical protein